MNARKGLLEKCPDPDIFINNSGGPPQGISDWTESDFIDAFKSNFYLHIIYARCNSRHERKENLAE